MPVAGFVSTLLRKASKSASDMAAAGAAPLLGAEDGAAPVDNESKRRLMSSVVCGAAEGIDEEGAASPERRSVAGEALGGGDSDVAGLLPGGRMRGIGFGALPATVFFLTVLISKLLKASSSSSI